MPPDPIVTIPPEFLGLAAQGAARLKATPEAQRKQPTKVIEDASGQGAAPEPAHLTTDESNAKRLAEHYRDRLAYTATGWHVWDGKRWKPDDDLATALGATLGALIAKEASLSAERAAKCDDKGERRHLAEITEALSKHSARSEDLGKIRAALELAKPKLKRPVEDFDADPLLLNCTNGTLDLRAGSLRPHDPSMFLTKIAGTTFEPDADCPTWHRFLDEVFLGDGPLVEFLQRFLGYALTGLTREHVLPIALGTGANGKGTLIGAVQAALGEYARPAPAGMFETRRDSRDDQHIALLRGLRLVIGSETARGSELREAFIKNATGGDRLSGRKLYGEPFDFSPTHKLLLATNHRPRVRGTDEGIWRRLLLIPFEARFMASLGNLDERMGEKLRTELPGILAWMVKGFKAWQKIGLAPPPKVHAATAEYRASEDLVAQFIEERCVLDPTADSPSGEVYAAFKSWCEAGGLKPLSQRGLTMELKRYGVVPTTARGRPLLGLRLGNDGCSACSAYDPFPESLPREKDIGNKQKEPLSATSATEPGEEPL